MALAGILTIGLLVAVPGAGQAAAATTLTVDSIDDLPDANPADRQCRTSAGTCSLRAAIDEANAQAGPDTIRFDIPGNRIHTIDIGSTLRLNDMSGGTVIDGYTQPGAQPNSLPLESNADIRIEITTDDQLAPMLLITSPGNTVRGLSLYGNGARIELRGEEADGNRLLGNYIGLSADATKTSALASNASTDLRRTFTGIALNLGPDRNVIGTSDRADRNVIAGNERFGMRINHGETSQNIVENNIFGLGPQMEPLPRQVIGVDVQWWTWGNLVIGNLFSGHDSHGVDLSHSSTGNAVIDNRFGTFADGNSASEDTTNRWGMSFKDDSVNNYVADNVFANSYEAGIRHRHNYTGANTVVNNRIGVGSGGAQLGNVRGIWLRGQDDRYIGNIIANNDVGVDVTDETPPMSGNTRFPPEETLRNRFHQTTFYDNGNDEHIVFDPAFVPHGGLAPPAVTAIGPGEVYGTTCARCEVEVFVSGRRLGDGTIDTGSTNRGRGAGWIGRALADSQGRWSLAHPDIIAGKDLTTLAIDRTGSTSTNMPSRRVPGSLQGSGSNAAASLGPVAVPPAPARPPAWEPDLFTCSWSGGTLSWENEGAPEYYVRSVDAAGAETYLGARTGTSTAIPDAAGYRVVNWVRGFARSAICDGPGDPANQPGFACSYAGGTLSWTDEGVGRYYIRTVDAAGNDSYFGATGDNSLTVPAAAGYQVIHWVGGRNIATCDGPGEPVGFSCSYAGGTLSWTDQNVDRYYIRTVDAAGNDSYFGSSDGTSLTVPAAAGYQVIHWVGGRNIATCDGP